MSSNWLVCGTRKKGYRQKVFNELNKLLEKEYQNQGYKIGLELTSDDPLRISKAFSILYKPESIIEGCCPDSADVWAEEWAKDNNIPIQHHPSHAGNYLKRNIEMVEKASLVIAFWDGYSYGTAHAISQAVMRKVPVVIHNIKEVDKDVRI